MKAYKRYEDCDQDDPQEHLLWGLLNVQMGDYESMPIQPNTARVISKHLYELGFRHNPELQTKKLQMPVRGQQSPMNGLTRWVPIDAKDPKPLMLPNVRDMTPEEREWVHKELKNVGHIQDPPKDLGPLAAVTTWEELQVKSQRVTSAEAINDSTGPEQ